MDAETGFLIESKVYEVPTLDSLTLDEAELLYDRCGLVQEDFVKEHGETDGEHEERVAKMTRHPGFMASLVQIAYQRGNPNVKPGAVKLVLGKTNRLEVFSTLGGVEEEPEVPLASTSKPSEASSNGSLENGNSTKESTATSGNGSENDSVAPGGHLVRIGTTSSGTSFTSGQRTLAGSGPAT